MIQFKTKKETVATVAYFMRGTSVMATLAQCLANEVDGDVLVTLDEESILQVRDVLGRQPESIVAKINKELDSLLFSIITQDAKKYADLLGKLTLEEERRGVIRQQIAADGHKGCEEISRLLKMQVGG